MEKREVVVNDVDFSSHQEITKLFKNIVNPVHAEILERRGVRREEIKNRTLQIMIVDRDMLINLYYVDFEPVMEVVAKPAGCRNLSIETWIFKRRHTENGEERRHQKR